MPFILILTGMMLITTAWSGGFTQLETELKQDIPNYFKWGVALAALVAIGFVPGLKTPSRWLVALVLVVIVLRNYSTIINQYQSFTQAGIPSGVAVAPNPITGQYSNGTNSPSGNASSGLSAGPDTPVTAIQSA